MLEAQIDGWNVIILGKWNPAIFSPQWVGQHVFEGEEMEVEFPITPGLSPRYKAGRVMITLQGDRLLVKPLQTDDESMRSAEQKAVRILDCLPHTPVRAVGINFRYVESQPANGLSRMFEFADSDRIREFGYDKDCVEILRHLDKDNAKLTFKMSQSSDGSLILDFNHHSDVLDAVMAREVIREHVVERCSQTTEFITGVCNLSMAEVDHGSDRL